MQKKILSMLLVSAMLTSGMSVLADTVSTTTTENISYTENVVNEVEFIRFEAVINSIEEGQIRTTVDENEVVFKTHKAVVYNSKGEEAELSEGDTIIAFVEADEPAPLVLPATYTASVFIKNVEDGMNVDVDEYDEKDGVLVNKSNTLALNIDKTTEVVGEDTDGDLIVFYGASTRSIPAQTTPVKVIELDEVEDKNEKPEEEKKEEFTEPEFISLTAVIDSIEEDKLNVTAGEEEMIINTHKAVVFNSKGEEAELVEGDEITVYVDADEPAILMLPVTYTADVIIKNVEGGFNIDVDEYDAKYGVLVNKSNTLALNIDHTTELLDINMKANNGEYDDELLVFYGDSTKSIPAQTTPVKVVGIGDEKEEPEKEDKPEKGEKPGKPDKVGVKIKGEYIDFGKYENVYPKIKSDKTLVPIRAVAEALGALVEWDGETKVVKITNGDTIIEMTIGVKVVKVNGEDVESEVAPEISDDYTFVPIRLVSDSLGNKVDWDADNLTVVIE